jgi:hypothetical protein
MIKRILLLTLLIPTLGYTGELFYRVNGDTSVTIGDICVPAADGIGIYALDFNTTNLTIDISAQGDGVDNAVFTYTGVNIDDYDDTPPAWGNPVASAIELEVQASNCIKLHIRDEVFAVSNATEWSIRFTDSTTDAIMDWHVQVLDVADSTDFQSAVAAALSAYDPPTNTEMEARTVVAANYATAANLSLVETDIASVQTTVDAIEVDTGTVGVVIANDAITAATIAASAIGASEIAADAIDASAIATDAVTEIQAGLATSAEITALNDPDAASITAAVLAAIIEDQGVTYSLQCTLAAILAYAAGDVTTAAGTSTYKETSSTENRIVGTVSGSTRNTTTITCP